MILIIDDDISIRASLSFMLKRAGYEVVAVSSPKEAMVTIRDTAPQLILMDMNFSLSTSGDEGITLLKQVKLFRKDVPIILMTAWGSIDLAVKGMRAGAFDFITKPWNNASLLQRIETALELNSIDDKCDKECSQSINSPNKEEDSFDRSFIIGNSDELNKVLDVVKRVAKTNASVLITGESGTGKELIAEALHRNSMRKNKNFVKVNLGGISQSLFESEMFGHKKGAFTDASNDRIGRFELADKGTIFLDEIGDLDIGSQVKLLRVLQDQTFEPLGDSHAHKVDLRIVSATNADLTKRIAEHSFREDLFYRINLITVHLPALRDRREDIPLLAKHFAHKQCEINNIPQVEFSQDAMNLLTRLPYSGNIRELKNLVERTIIISSKKILTADDFKPQINIRPETNTAINNDGLTLDDIEKRTIILSLKKHNNNLCHVALDLGLSRAALYRRLEKYNIDYKK
ncbi:sigma-54-dependent transcriptional regulator [Prevotella sp.]|uniref:sigma-54-dependent transcriptional regulator n=1 Tax=Prevotella sp. TaxID=59823 RepID=UPI003DA2F3DE